MSFSIILQSNLSPANYINKSIQDVVTYQGELRDSCSIIDPVIMIESSDFSSFVSKINYLSIPTFERYYFVKDIASYRTNLWQIFCHVDVLMSFREEILANQGIIRRQEDKYNLYLDDGIFKAYQDPLVQVKKFPSGFTAQEYVLIVAGS